MADWLNIFTPFWLLVFEELYSKNVLPCNLSLVCKFFRNIWQTHYEKFYKIKKFLAENQNTQNKSLECLYTWFLFSEHGVTFRVEFGEENQERIYATFCYFEGKMSIVRKRKKGNDDLNFGTLGVIDDPRWEDKPNSFIVSYIITDPAVFLQQNFCKLTSKTARCSLTIQNDLDVPFLGMAKQCGKKTDCYCIYENLKDELLKKPKEQLRHFANLLDHLNQIVKIW